MTSAEKLRYGGHWLDSVPHMPNWIFAILITIGVTVVLLSIADFVLDITEIISLKKKKLKRDLEN